MLKSLPFLSNNSFRERVWLAFAFACLLPLVFLDYAGFPDVFVSEFKVRLCLTFAAIAVVIHRVTCNHRWPLKKCGIWLIIAAMIAAASYFNFGSFLGRTSIHAWEQFHYVLGAKYFPELRYDGLYVASVQAENETLSEQGRTLDAKRVVRDLRDNVIKPVRDIASHRQEVRARFDDARWRDFKDDHRFFMEQVRRPGFMQDVRQDRGFNAPPTWVFQAQLVISQQTFDAAHARQLAHIDTLLILVMFVVLYWAFGARVLCLALVIFGLNHCGRLAWIGGGLLREDWLACTLISVSLVKKNHYIAAGFFLGWAASLRVFPLLFLFAPAVFTVRAWCHGQRVNWPLWMVAGFILALATAGVCGTYTGRGWLVWREFYSAIILHRDTWLTNNIGFENLLLYDWKMMTGEYVNRALLDPWEPWYAYMSQARLQNGAATVILKGVALLALVVVLWKLVADSRREEGIVLAGLLAVFVLLLTSNYYWQMLVLLAILPGNVLVIAFLILNGIVIGVNLMSPSYETRFAVFTAGIALILIAALAVSYIRKSFCTLAR